MAKNNLEQWLLSYWYAKTPRLINRLVGLILAPFSWLVHYTTKQRFKNRSLLTAPNQASLIVVGNITVGGTGKTPIIIWLAQMLQSKGYAVGVIARGHGAGQVKALEVTRSSLTSEVGDEPLDIWRKLNSERQAHPNSSYTPVFIAEQRNDARLELQRSYPVDVILSDDGLQHYALPRTFEIVVVDGRRGFGNGHILPKGPLREPLTRLASVDRVILNGTSESEILKMIRAHNTSISEFSLKFESVEPLNTQAKYLLEGNQGLRNLASANIEDTRRTMQDQQKSQLASLLGHLAKEHRSLALVAGIGHPERFFSMLTAEVENQGYDITLDTYKFPDHYFFAVSDFHKLGLDKNTVILMTDKDAIKCRQFAEQLENAVFTLSVSPLFDDLDWLDIMIQQTGLASRKL